MSKPNECVCGRGEECNGVSAAFQILRDPRCSYSRLPKKRTPAVSHADVQLNRFRERVLYHILPSNQKGNDNEEYSIANHHFHPGIVSKYVKKAKRTKKTCALPMSLPAEVLKFCDIKLNDDDKVLDEHGKPTGEYYVVPNYSFTRTKKRDLKECIRARQHPKRDEAAGNMLLSRISGIEEPDAGAGSSLAQISNSKCKENKILDGNLVPKDTEEQMEGSNIEKQQELDHEIAFLSTSASFPSRSSSTRELDNANMLAFESKRRSTVNAMWDALYSKWRACAEMLRNGVYETQRAERLVLGSAHANQVFGSTMEAIHDGVCLPESGNTLSGITKQEQLSSSGSNLNGSSASLDGSGKDDELDKAAEFDSPVDDILSALVESQSTLSDEFSESALLLSLGVGEEMSLFCAEHKANAQEMVQLGNALIRDLKAVEKMLLEAWDAFDAVAAGGGANPPPFASPQPRRKSANSLATPSALSANKPAQLKDRIKSPDSVVQFPSRPSLSSPPLSPLSARSLATRNVNDIWLVEMHYRVLVACQSLEWKKAGVQLTNLFESVLRTECERQKQLHELLLAFVNTQNRLFSGTLANAAAIPKRIFAELEKHQTREELESEIRDAVEKHAKVLQPNGTNDAVLSIPDKFHGITGPEDVAVMALEELDTPFTGELVRSCNVFEGKWGWNQYKPVLAVVSADSFLHLFEIPSSNLELSPMEAFIDIMPSVKFEDGGPSSVLKSLTPAKSLYLPDCKIAPSLEDGGILELAAFGRFRKAKTRKIMLRTPSKEDATEWINAIRHLSGATRQKRSALTVSV